MVDTIFYELKSIEEEKFLFQLFIDNNMPIYHSAMERFKLQQFGIHKYIAWSKGELHCALSTNPAVTRHNTAPTIDQFLSNFSLSLSTIYELW